MKLLKVLILITLILSGCATVGVKQNECEKQYSAFVDIVNCTKHSFASDPRANNSLVKLYFLKGDELAEKVKQGKISDIDAKTDWQAEYVQLQALERANKPRYTNCYSYGGNINCTTY